MDWLGQLEYESQAAWRGPFQSVAFHSWNGPMSMGILSPSIRRRSIGGKYTKKLITILSSTIFFLRDIFGGK
jgi:hypothetical protein